MRNSIEFILGLLESDRTAYVSAEDWEGEHGAMLRSWQGMGLMEKEPGVNPVASCPHCEEGVPYQLQGRLLCDSCHSTVDPRYLLLWRLNLAAFLGWVADRWALLGGVRRIDEQLWQLGTMKIAGGIYECFYRRVGRMSEAARNRLAAYRQSIVLCGAALPDAAEAVRRPHLCLVELLHYDGALSLADPSLLLRPRGAVRFDAASGTLWAGQTWLGEVPVGSKECHFLDVLAQNLDRFVPYADLKYAVLQRSGGSDSRDEATFCHRIKSRIKHAFVPQIDQFVVTANKGEGYRLCARGER